METLQNSTKIKENERALLTKCNQAIKRIDTSAEVILYGSRARGEAEHESDYDLMIISKQDATLKKEEVFRSQLYPIELDTGAVLTIMLVSKQDWESSLYSAMPLCQNVKRDGVLL